jgi:hypothetical protein
MSAKVPTTAADGAIPRDTFKYSPLERVRSLFTGFVQGLFNAAPPGQYHWEPDDSQSTSEIYISNENPIKTTTAGTRPAISFTRGPVQYYSLGLDDMLQFNMATGTKEKSVLVPGTMSINCCSRVALESEFLAWVCAEQLWLHRELLLQAGFFEVGRMPAIGSPTAAGSLVAGDSGDEWFATIVTCPYQFYRTSRVTPLNKPMLQELQMNIVAHMAAAAEMGVTIGGHGGAPASPGVNLPVSVFGTRPPPYAPQASDIYGNTPNPTASGPPLLPLVPHPLNPAQLVTVRSSRPNSPAVKPPAIGGRTIPIQSSSVEESSESETDVTATFKV